MRVILFFVFLSLNLFPMLAHSQSGLELNVTDLQDFDKNPVRLENLVIEGSSEAGVANFTVTATIGNIDEFDEIEAEFILPLPMGAIVNDYALDIEGRLVDGVLTERERARKEYTDRVVGEIDPGFAETLNDNRYRTTIYPVLEGSKRIIRMGFSVPLDQDLNWIIKSDVRANQLTIKAKDFDVELKSENAPLELSIPLQKPEKTLRSTLVNHPIAGDFALLALTQDEIGSLTLEAGLKSDKIALIWDSSQSRSDDNIGEEYAMISKILSDLGPSQIDLIIGNDRIKHRKTYRGEIGAALVSAKLSQSSMDGGTRLPSLFPSDLSADLCLLFSDGNSLHSGGFPIPDCPVIAISSAQDVKPGVLTALAEQTGGQYMNLAQLQKKGLPKSLAPALASKDLIHPRWLGAPQTGLIMGRLKEGAGKNIEITIGSTQDDHTINHRLRDKITHKGLPTVWARTEAEFLRAEGLSVPELIDFSRPFSLAGPETALIVLEEPEDYVNAEIPPPASYPKDLIAEYKEDLAEYEEDKADALAERRGNISEVAEELLDWYSELYYDYDYVHDYDSSELPLDQQGQSQPQPIGPPGAPRPPSHAEAQRFNVEQDFIVVTASRLEATIPVIRPRDWSPDRPYLKAMKRASDQRLVRVYEDQKLEFGNLPAFFLESADLFHKKGLSDKASQIVQGALELPSSNTQSYTQVAHRLLAYGDYDRAIEIYEFVKGLSPNLPYVYYNLALALHDRSLIAAEDNAQDDLIRAMANLEHVLDRDWGADYEGIEMVALSEANVIYHKLPRATRRTSPYAILLHRPIQSDLRVVIDWNTDYTDLDLLVHEPSGEIAYFSNTETTIGGFMSNDMTEGYGPEQYLLNYAIAGTYKITAKYFSDSEYDPNGPVTIRTRITRHFGSEDQTTETIIMELSDEKDEEDVGEFIVAE